MARPRIVDVDYYEFLRALQQATARGERIETTDKERWSAWVRDNRVREAAFKSIASGKYEGLEPVIIENGEWRGYYLVSKQDEACLKWERDA